MSYSISMTKSSERTSERSPASSLSRSPSESSLSSLGSDFSGDEYMEQTRCRTRRSTSSTSSEDSTLRPTVYYVINDEGQRIQIDKRIFEDSFNAEALRRFCATYNEEPTDAQIAVLADMLQIEFNPKAQEKQREYRKHMKELFSKHQWCSGTKRTQISMALGYKEGKMKADLQKMRKTAMDAFLTKGFPLPCQMKTLMKYEEKYNKTSKKKLAELTRKIVLKTNVHGAQVVSFMNLARDRKAKFERKLRRAARTPLVDSDFEMEENYHERNDDYVRNEENGNNDDM
ncbi:hypothetical protein GCK72_026191 [Caenorhabditis remanei]|uniref:Uncharacterized protein n=1 Tax=Caenorhabditis remanei TaxID=31234 RepID=A0A6A5G4I8_CAERE|nr:hypothetical protein GCK72_026191 [Caenorhabditis remanei]KAF1749723.1 hypothetical protein GCK72_026191 [Caenorhabditis remanei]